MYRTHTCGELNTQHIGQNVQLAGRVAHHRNMGGMMFIDLRDRYGITQLHIPADNQKLLEQAQGVKHEFVIQIQGTVIARPEGQVNTQRSTGEIEVEVEQFTILTKSDTLPFSMEDDPNTSEENRFKHRFLDLRRRPVLDNIIFRSRMNHFTRNRFVQEDFLEVQTPIFSVSSPEGARDYIIPSRVNPGKFYALPQAPQQYKQLLMVGGIDKYFQIAPCFRDEDPRADRHSCEFYQVDAELSFVTQEQVREIAERYIQDLCRELVPEKKLIGEFPKIPYHEAMQRYGSDKPDLRFGCEFKDISTTPATQACPFFADALQQGGVVKTVTLPDHLISRKEADQLTEIARNAGASGLGYMVMDPEGTRGPLAKFFDETQLQELTTATQSTSGDTIFFLAGEEIHVLHQLNYVRLGLRDMFHLAPENSLAFCRITDFPFYEEDSEGNIDFGHNPFSMVHGGKDAFKQDNLLDIISQQYDMVCNGYEILSGSIRNHDPEVLIQAFTTIGKDPQEIKNKFGALYTAFQYGAPPHGGFAFGFDRLLMILKDESNIREIYAFPKSGRAEDVMMGAPSYVDSQQLEELQIALSLREE